MGPAESKDSCSDQKSSNCASACTSCEDKAGRASTAVHCRYFPVDLPYGSGY